MAIVINTNMASNKLIRQLNDAADAYQVAVEKLSTGININSAADNPAGFALAKGMEKFITGSAIASSNITSATNMVKAAEGVLDVIQDNLLRIRDLTLQAMNGTYSEKERDALEAEAKARAEEIDRLSKGAKFNDFTIFNTSKTSSDYVLVQVGTEADAATNTIKIQKLFYGATLSSLCTSLNSATFAFSENDSTMQTLITNLDKAIANATERITIAGYSLNRMEAAQSALDVMKENIISAHSNLVDTDVAETSSEYTKQYIMQQTVSSLLTQANQMPSLAMSLI